MFLLSWVFSTSPSSFRASFSFLFLFLFLVLCNLDPWKALHWVFYHLPPFAFFCCYRKSLYSCFTESLSCFFVIHGTAWTLWTKWSSWIHSNTVYQRCMDKICLNLMGVLLHLFHTYVTDILSFWKCLSFYSVSSLKRAFYLLQYLLIYLRLPLFHSFLVLYLFRLSLDVFSASFFYPFCCKLSFTCFPIFTGLIIYSFSRLSLNSKYFSSFSLSSQFCSSFFYESSYVFLV